MCGIAGIHRLGNRPVPKLDDLATALLAEIESRGRDATGYVAIDDGGGVQLQKASCSAFYFNRNRARISGDARTVLLHTRFATQGKPAFPENNHPVEAGGIYAVHNGHIHNDADLFAQLDAARRGQVDSEAIPALIVARGWDSLPGCLTELDGDLAVALIDAGRPGDLVLARGNYSPLYYLKGNGFLVWASTREAIVKAWGSVLGTPPQDARVMYMLEGESLLVREGKLETRVWEPGASWRHGYTTAYYPATPAGGLAKLYAFSQQVTAGALAEADAMEDEGESCSPRWNGDPQQRCDDCGHWHDTSELEEAHTVVGLDWLCPSCYAWAEEVGAIKA